VVQSLACFARREPCLLRSFPLAMRKHHVAFLITDLGIITLLMGRTQETEFYARQALIALENDACQ
jgi:hypothetical protein